MFGGRPVILVKQAPQATPALFEELLGAPLAAFIIIEAGNLKKDAKLRQLFEKAKNAAAIICYGADSRGAAAADPRGCRTGRADHRARCGAAPRPASRRRLGGVALRDRQADALCRRRAANHLGHVEAVVGDASAHAFDEAIAAALAGDVGAALAQLDGLAGAGTPASVLLMVLSGHLQKLHAVLAAVDRGESFDAAAARLRPPPHFRQKDAMKAQAARWTVRAIAAAIEAAHETIRQTRLKPALEHELAGDFILRLARRGSGRVKAG